MLKQKEPTKQALSGAQFLRELYRTYEIADAPGRALAQQAARALDDINAARAHIRAEGRMVKDRYGSWRQNPAIKLAREAATEFRSALRALNLDVEPPIPKPGRPAGTSRTILPAFLKEPKR